MIKHKNGGHWAFPKGHVEKKETEPETALREIKEETGLKVELDTGFREMVTYSPKPNVMKDVIYFAAKAKKGQRPPPARGGFGAPLGAAPRGAGLGHLRHRPGSLQGLFAVPGAIVISPTGKAALCGGLFCCLGAPCLTFWRDAPFCCLFYSGALSIDMNILDKGGNHHGYFWF